MHCPKPKPASAPPHVSPNWVQSVHGWPKAPHAVGSVPGTHALPSQQPLQFGPQKLVFSQKPPEPGPCGTHWAPKLAQLSQAWPKAPHSFGSTPGRHEVPRQQPLQFGPQRLLFSQKPPKPPPCETHCPPVAAQLWQTWPPMPHSFGSMPGRHALPRQQPGHVPGLHPIAISQMPPPGPPGEMH